MKRVHLTLFNSLLLLTLVIIFAVGCSSSAPASSVAPSAPTNPEVILATTTSTQDSGLLDELIPIFEKQSGYIIKPIAVGTGAALEMGKKGEADILLVHAPSSEKLLVDNKTVINYQLVMHNDFVIVGPSSDPAKIKNEKKVVSAFKSIAENQSLFISRGDDSGTHKMEKNLWTKADIQPAGTWYQESGSGMGQTLNIASEKEGYTLTDRATFLSNSKNLQLEIVLEGDASLLNIYHVMQVNPEKFSKVNSAGGKAFVDFMIHPDIQKIIGDFGKDKYGQSLFFPDAGKKMEDL
ncbi:MAG: tungsten ABC transporter substrate-binding protein [Gracilibacter sp. BRH_c7a]|nr:MAG: tungsten ABC transporter substrate-binding protein [Gracilibacter sp. BRH_c7a]